MKKIDHENTRWSSGEYTPVLVAVSVLVAVMAIPTASLFYVWTFGRELSGDHSRWAQFGDYLGGVLSPIFAFLGFLALLVTIYIQTRELRHSVRILGEQSESLRLQNFESAFFEMVRFHHDIVKDMDFLLRTGTRVEGRDCFKRLFERLERSYVIEMKRDASPSEPLAVAAYRRFYDANQHEVGHYFRNVYRILKFVDRARVEEKADYTGILRAQLSSYELALLFYNALSPVGTKLKPLVEKYALLENMDVRLLIRADSDVSMFAAEAYGDQDVSEYFRFVE